MSKAGDAKDRLANVKEISSAEWTEEEVEFVHEHTKGRTQLLDQDHIPILAAQATTVPPRPRYILKDTNVDPLPQLLSVSNGLVSAGATHLAIICNTAHHFWGDVAKQLPETPCLDMIHLTLKYVAKLLQNQRKAKIGLFATKGTLLTNMYPKLAKENFNLNLVSPLEIHENRQNEIETTIFGSTGIKSGFDDPDQTPEARESLKRLLIEALHLKRTLNVNIIILACSELPLIINQGTINRWVETLFSDEVDRFDIQEILFVDPGRVLVHEILKLSLLSRDPVRY